MIIETAAIISAFAAVSAVIVSLLNRKNISELHISLNSRLTALVDATRIGARAEGHAEGVEQGRKDQRAETEPK